MRRELVVEGAKGAALSEVNQARQSWTTRRIPSAAPASPRFCENFALNLPGRGSSLGKGNAFLPLVLPAAVLVGNFADFIRLVKQHLCHSLVGVDLRR